jgi:hypothetical protein
VTPVPGAQRAEPRVEWSTVPSERPRAASPEEFLRSLDEAKAERRRLKVAERSVEERVLEPWERYRALIDYYHALQDLSEQGDRKTRFALLILGGLNAINLLLVMRGEVVGLPAQGGAFTGAYVASYSLISLAVFLYSIAALRPAPAPTRVAEDVPPLWSSDAALAAPAEAYVENWRGAQVGQITRELAQLVYRTTQGNAARTRSLERVYAGLSVLVALTAALMLTLALASLTAS